MPERKGNFKGRKKGARDKRKRRRRLRTALRLGAGIGAAGLVLAKSKKLDATSRGVFAGVVGLGALVATSKLTTTKEEKEAQKQQRIKILKPSAKYIDPNQSAIRSALNIGSLAAGGVAAVTTVGLLGKNKDALKRLKNNPRLARKYIGKVVRVGNKAGAVAGVLGLGVGAYLGKKKAEQWNKDFDKKSELTDKQKRNVALGSLAAAGLGIYATRKGIGAVLKTKAGQEYLQQRSKQLAPIKQAITGIGDESLDQLIDVRANARKRQAMENVKEQIRNLKPTKTAEDLRYTGKPSSGSNIIGYNPTIQNLTEDQLKEKAHKIAYKEGRKLATQNRLELKAIDDINNAGENYTRRNLNWQLTALGGSVGIGAYNLGRSVNRRIKKTRENKDKK
jgi:hypothetical protein